MKKRILSLILAFAMAATLAPATALVGGNVAKAADDGELVSIDIGSTAKPTSAAVVHKVNRFVDEVKVDFKFHDTNASNDEAVDLVITQVNAPSAGQKIGVDIGSKDKNTNTFTLYGFKKAEPGIYTFHYVKKDDSSAAKHPSDAGVNYVCTPSLTGHISGDFKIEVSYSFPVNIDLNGGELESSVTIVADPSDASKEYVKNSESSYTNWVTGTDKDNPGSWTILDASDVTRPGYVLDGWTSLTSGVPSIGDSSAVSTITKETTYRAVWKKDTVNITLDSNGGHVPNSSVTTISLTQDLGSALPKNAFVREGYKFKGWTHVNEGGIVRFADGAAITSDLYKAAASTGALHAVWEPITYTVNFNINTPEGAKVNANSKNMVSITKKYDTGKRLPLNTFVVDEYQFVCWAADPDGMEKVYLKDGAYDDSELGNEDGASSITLYAVWKKGSTVVVYENEAGTASNSVYAALSADDMSRYYPNKLIRIGYEVTSFTDADKISIATGAHSYDESGIAVEYPVFSKPIEYAVKYNNTETGAVVTTTKTNYVTVETGNVSLPKYTISLKKDLKGWDITATDASESFMSSFNAKGVIDAIIDEMGAAAGVAELEGNGITLEAKYLPNSKSAALSSAIDINVNYGTRIEDIEAYLKTQIVVLDQDGNAIGATGSAIDKVVWTTSYSPITAGKSYSFKGTVYLKNTAVNNPGTTYKVGYEKAATDKITVTVLSESDSADNTAYYMGSLKTLELPGETTPADIAYELSLLSVNLRGDNNKKDEAFKLNTVANWTIVNPDYASNNNAGGDTFAATSEDASVANSGNVIYNRNITTPVTLSASYAAITTSDLNSGTIKKIPVATSEITDLYIPTVLVKISAAKSEDITAPDADKETETLTAIAKAHEMIAKGIAVRLYRPGEHMYVMTGEVDTMIKNGWKLENDDAGKNSFKASTTQTAVYDTPVYRVYNKNNGGMHFYTKSKAEADGLVKAGWSADYKGEPVFYVSSDATGNKVYRAYNPNSKNGEHNWTWDKGEHDKLVKLGWKDESTDANIWYSPAN